MSGADEPRLGEEGGEVYKVGWRRGILMMTRRILSLIIKASVF